MGRGATQYKPGSMWRSILHTYFGSDHFVFISFFLSGVLNAGIRNAYEAPLVFGCQRLPTTRPPLERSCWSGHWTRSQAWNQKADNSERLLLKEELEHGRKAHRNGGEQKWHEALIDTAEKNFKATNNFGTERCNDQIHSPGRKSSFLCKQVGSGRDIWVEIEHLNTIIWLDTQCAPESSFFFNILSTVRDRMWCF